MSGTSIFDYLRAARSAAGLSKHAHAVLYGIVAHLNSRTGEAWPSVGALMAATGWGRRSVQEGIAELVGEGAIVIMGGRTGGRSKSGLGRSTRYRVDLEALRRKGASGAPLKSASEDAEGRTPRPGRAHGRRAKGAPDAPEVSSEGSNEGGRKEPPAPRLRDRESGQNPRGDHWGLDTAFSERGPT